MSVSVAQLEAQKDKGKTKQTPKLGIDYTCYRNAPKVDTDVQKPFAERMPPNDASPPLPTGLTTANSEQPVPAQVVEIEGKDMNALVPHAVLPTHPEGAVAVPSEDPIEDCTPLASSYCRTIKASPSRV